MIDETGSSSQQIESKEWYETLFGLIILSVGLNVVSNYIYDKARQKLWDKDTEFERKLARRHLREYHDKSAQDAIKEEGISFSKTILEP